MPKHLKYQEGNRSAVQTSNKQSKGTGKAKKGGTVSTASMKGAKGNKSY